MILVKMKCKFKIENNLEKLRNKLHIFHLIKRIETEEDFVDSEYEEDDEATNKTDAKQQSNNTPKISWLLQIALENLGVTVCDYIVSLFFS